MTPAQRTLHLKEPQNPEQARLKEALEIADAMLDDPKTNADLVGWTAALIKNLDEWRNKSRNK